MTKTFTIWKIVYITVIFKDEYIRFEFYKAITYGIFRGVECRSWERGEMSSSDCGSNAQGHTWSILIWSFTSKTIFNTILLMHFTRKKNQPSNALVGAEELLHTQTGLERAGNWERGLVFWDPTIILCLTYWLKFIFLFNVIYH